MLCWFLPYHNTNQSIIITHTYVCIYHLPLEPLSSLPSYPSRWGWAPHRLGSLCYLAASYELSILNDKCNISLPYLPFLLNNHLPGGVRGKESTCQGRRQKRHGFDPWVRKIPLGRKWQPIPVSLPGKSHGQTGGLQSIGSCRVRHNWSNWSMHTQRCFFQTWKLTEAFYKACSNIQ